MSSVFCIVDDKHVPLYRIIWISELPHFCGNDECPYEGRYEIRLEDEEAVFANREERDKALVDLEAWAGGGEADDNWP